MYIWSYSLLAVHRTKFALSFGIVMYLVLILSQHSGLFVIVFFVEIVVHMVPPGHLTWYAAAPKFYGYLDPHYRVPVCIHVYTAAIVCFGFLNTRRPYIHAYRTGSDGETSHMLRMVDGLSYSSRHKQDNML